MNFLQIRYVTEMTAINIGPSLKGHRITVSESEAAINRMVRNMLLNKVNFMFHFISVATVNPNKIFNELVQNFWIISSADAVIIMCFKLIYLLYAHTSKFL